MKPSSDSNFIKAVRESTLIVWRPGGRRIGWGMEG
jgi:hypothetical protein